MLKDFTPRLYQETILNTCTKHNTLVVLPTGLGKTNCALLLAAHRLKLYPTSKVLFIAPTKPLVEQHFNTFKKHLEIEEDKLVVLTGLIPPEKRESLWKNAQIIFSTPQGLENDIISSRINLEDVSLLVIDECHRSTGEYSYVFLAKQYQKKARFPKILALTASPGDDLEKIMEICNNLFIEEVEIRSEDDSDVKPYLQEVDMKFVKVDLPEEFNLIKKFLELCYKSKLEEVKKNNHISSIMLRKVELIQLQAKLFAEITSNRDPLLMKSVSLVAEALKVHHAIELLETQGISQLYAYFEKLEAEASSGKTKAAKNLSQDINFRTAFIKTKSLYEKKIEHPKLNALSDLVSEKVKKDNKTKIIIFTQFRDSASLIKQKLDEQKILSEIFVGQAKKKTTGLSQKQQIEMLNLFKDGMFNVLIATSVAEEGLDIPSVDCVVFYEPVPSAIRHIQRRGRTGRHDKGNVIVLVAKNTRDEAYSFSAKAKEKRMNMLLKDLKTKIKSKLTPQIQQTLVQKETEKVLIFADYREKSNSIVKELLEMNTNIKLDSLEHADYILSSKVGVELKHTEDFVNSIIDGRLLEQLKELKRNFEKPLIIIEGREDLYNIRQIHPNAIRGMLATISVSFGIPILNTKDNKETAEMLYTIAKREQEFDKGTFNPHFEKKSTSVREHQEYIVSSFPNIGPNLAKELLKNFKTLKNIINANEEELKKVSGVGEKIAKGIKEVGEGEYK